MGKEWLQHIPSTSTKVMSCRVVGCGRAVDVLRFLGLFNLSAVTLSAITLLLLTLKPKFLIRWLLLSPSKSSGARGQQDEGDKKDYRLASVRGDSEVKWMAVVKALSRVAFFTLGVANWVSD